MGFDQLMSLVPSLANQRNAKVSKATVLQKSKGISSSFVFNPQIPTSSFLISLNVCVSK